MCQHLGYIFEIWILDIEGESRDIVILKSGYRDITTPVPAPFYWPFILGLWPYNGMQQSVME